MDGFWCGLGAKLRVAEIDHTWIVTGDPVHRPRSQAHDEPHKTLLTFQARTPDHRAVAICDSCQRWEIVLTMSLALYLLEQDRHPFIVIQQTHTTPVHKSIGTEDAG